MKTQDMFSGFQTQLEYCHRRMKPDRSTRHSGPRPKFISLWLCTYIIIITLALNKSTILHTYYTSIAMCI